MRHDMKIAKSFAYVKNDMNQLYNIVRDMQIRINELEENNLRLVSAMTVMGEIVASSQRRQLAAKRPAVRKISASKRIVASKTGSKVHLESCAYAKNIKAFKKVEFSSVNAAKKVGFKVCSCLR